MEHKESHGPYQIPELIRKTLLAYKFEGRPTGGFLRAAIKNDLVDTIGRADPESFACIKDICRWLHWELPMSAFGEKNYKKWIKSGGLEGKVTR